MTLIFRLLCLLLIFTLPIAVKAKCLPEYFSGTFEIGVYEGSIANGYPIVMALSIQAKGNVDGRYALATSTTEIKIHGSLSDNRIELTEYDTNHQPISSFDGKFLEHDPKGSYSTDTPLQCEVLVGSWKNLRTGRNLPARLRNFLQPL